ncbi:MAG TPA: dihydropteroate synthase, partial [Gaiellales bacterium]|nr:dihydropteroate synthase [Gaiellales bacterium]
LVMGIVNVTPDSFYDRGVSARPAQAVARGLEMLEAGAALLDVGGMTARPGPALPAGEEIARVVPTIRGLRERTDAVIAVDTYRASVADAALRAGADLVNDHTGLSDPRMAATVASHGAGVVITHLGLRPKQQQAGRYALDVSEIARVLCERAELAVAAGVRRTAVLIDPGLGFGKDSATDLATLRALPALAALGYPLLLAPSHKEVTAEPLGLDESTLEGTAAVVAVAAFLGVAVLRVHDLPFMQRVARMAWLMRPQPVAAAYAGFSDGSKKDGRNSPAR